MREFLRHIALLLIALNAGGPSFAAEAQREANDISGYYEGWVGNPSVQVQLRIVDPGNSLGPKALWFRMNAPQPWMSGAGDYVVDGDNIHITFASAKVMLHRQGSHLIGQDILPSGTSVPVEFVRESSNWDDPSRGKRGCDVPKRSGRYKAFHEPLGIMTLQDGERTAELHTANYLVCEHGVLIRTHP